MKSAKHAVRIGQLLALVVMLTACGAPIPEESQSDLKSSQTAEVIDRAAAVAAETARFNSWVDEVLDEFMQRFSPQTLTSLGRAEGKSELNDLSGAALDELYAWRESTFGRMQEKFNYGLLDAEAQVTWDLALYTWEEEQRNRDFRRHDYLFTQLGSPHTSIPNFLINTHQVRNEEDMLAYLSRLNQIGTRVRQALDRAMLAAGEGIHAPYFAYEGVLNSTRQLISGKPFDESGQDSPLYRDVRAKLAGLRTNGLIDEAREGELLAEAQTALTSSMLPAYDELITWTESELALVGTTANGVGSLPDGLAYYDVRLAAMTTTDLGAEEIHAYGLSEVARIHTLMEELKGETGFTGSLDEFFTFMNADDSASFPDTDEGRQAYMDMTRSYLQAMEEKLPDFFGRLPKAPLEVRPYETFRDRPGRVPSYSPGSPDGSRPGVFFISMADISTFRGARIAGVAYHEGLPGHHMQISLAREMEGLPLFRQIYGNAAFLEGWGLYAEFLALEMGGYPDVQAKFGYLFGDLTRSMRLVVDTGIHAMGWSEQQALDYALANTPVSEASMRDEIRRYFVNPGQATAYKIGMKVIKDLRTRAEAELGEQFDIRAFHDEVLGGGALPLSLLERRINNWIASQQSGR